MMELPTLLDHRSIDWSALSRTSYAVHQRLRYRYPGPVHDLRQCLVVVPPERHGGQVLVRHQIEIEGAEARLRTEADRFGNCRYRVEVPWIGESVQFEICLEVERLLDEQETMVGPADLRRYALSSPLTRPDRALRALAAELMGTGARGLELADRIMERVYGSIRYTSGATGVRTTAAEALALGRGVCQDYAHVMLALCRLCKLPARYVSGHLLGEGGTHAWLEVLIPHDQPQGGGLAVAYDPTHNRRATPTYITVAVGREYRDVAPTSGSYKAPYAGDLSTWKRAGLTAVQPRDGAAA